MKNINILWADDEIEMLKPHILFLEAKGFNVEAVNNGSDAIDRAKEKNFDIIFLDEQMPGISGLDALAAIKTAKPSTPVVMITKSEAEEIMEAAIGSKISDFLIKPVNPNQILLSIKKNLDGRKLISEKTTSAYQVEFSKLGMAINEAQTFQEWVEVYSKIIYWEQELDKLNDNTVYDILTTQKTEANNYFCKYVENNYLDWLNLNNEDKPMLSPSIVKDVLMPHLKKGEKMLFLLIDNLRLDHWQELKTYLDDFYTTITDDVYCSILPSTTQYSRNSIFAGLMPLEIEKKFPQYWKNDTDEGTKNLYEEDLFLAQLKRLGFDDKVYFEKFTAVTSGKKVSERLDRILSSKLSVIVYNFVDTLSHARTEMEMLKELASDEKAYKSLIVSWFSHSPLYELLKEISKSNITLVVSTDHGSVKVSNPEKIVGEKNITTNLRYKQGKNLDYNKKTAFTINNPQEAFLPVEMSSNKYVFAKKNDFFAYPNNYNHYVKYYKDTFQHGGISMEELLIPIAVMKSK